MSTAAAGPPAASASPAVLSLLDAVILEAGRHGRADLQARLAHERERLAAASCRVVVVGEFKKGKSELVNALLDMRACAADPVETTVVPTLIRHATSSTATAITEPDGAASPARTRISLAEAHRLMLGTPEDIVDRTAIRGVEIGVPCDILAAGLTLIDTPGVNGGLADARAAVTLQTVADADALVFVSDASQEYSAPELEFLRRAAQICPVVVCALTKIDFYPQWRNILDLDRGHLRRAGIDAPVFPLSAPLRHHGLRAALPEIDTESGYPAFAVHIRSELVEHCRERARRDADEGARDSLAQIMAEPLAERAALDDPATTRALLSQLRAAEAHAQTMTSATARWQRTLREGSTRMQRRVADDLSQRLRAVEDEFRKSVEINDDPARTWDELYAGLCEQNNRALMAHRDMLEAEGAALARRVAAVFQVDETASGAVPDISAMLPPACGQPAPDGLDPQFRTYGRGALWSNALRSGAISMMPIHLVSAFGALAGLSLAPLLAPAGGAVMLVVAHRTLRASRESQLSAQRAQARRAGENYLQKSWSLEYEHSKRRQQDIDQALVNIFTDRAAELATSARRNLTSVARSIKATDAERRARIAALDAEISRIRTLAERYR